MRSDPHQLFRLSMLYQDAVCNWPIERVFRLDMRGLSDVRGHWVLKEPHGPRRLVVEEGFWWWGPMIYFGTVRNNRYDERGYEHYDHVHSMRLARAEWPRIQLRIDEGMETVRQDERKRLELRIDQFLGGCCEGDYCP